jgi:uncharacterized membrane protein
MCSGGQRVFHEDMTTVTTSNAATLRREIASASEQGIVQNLLLAQSATSTVSPLTPHDRKAVVTAVNECLLHRADVHVVDDILLPSGTHIAAILRY